METSRVQTDRGSSVAPLRKRKPRRVSFYLLFGAIGLLAVLAGFFTTYITPSLRGTLRVPAVVHLHGAFAFGWVALFFIQALAIRYFRVALHRQLGYLALCCAIGIVATLLPTAIFQVRRDLAAGFGATAISSILGVITTGLMFLVLVAAGYRYRKQPKVHKRLLLLATILVLWPAWFRFRHYFPLVPRPEFWFGFVLSDSMILLAWIAEWRTHRKIHPVLLWGGLFLIIENALEVWAFDSAPWRSLTRLIFETIS